MKPNLQKGGVIGKALLLFLVGWGIYSLFSDPGINESEQDLYYPSSYNAASVGSYLDYGPSEYADQEEDYSVGFAGTDTMSACNSETGNCYDLDIDSDGENVERINFPNGGWRDVEYSDCEDGYCVVEDEDGTEWELEY